MEDTKSHNEGPFNELKLIGNFTVAEVKFQIYYIYISIVIEKYSV